MTKPKQFKKTILFLAKKLQGHRYAFRGTTSLVLQGLEMNVDDIDILCDKKTALKCNQLLKDFLVEEVSYKKSPKFRSFFGKFKINKIQVEVMGDWQIEDTKDSWGEAFTACKKEITEILFNDQKMPVTKVETELLMFAKMGRWTAYHKIKKQLKPEKTTVRDFQQKMF